MSPPTYQEINVHGSRDEQIASEHFLGKDQSEAENLFREAGLVYQEDLMWMGPVAFRYYVIAAINYLYSRESKGDSDFVQCFTSILEFRLKDGPTELAPIADKLSFVLRYIMGQYEKFNLVAEIDGNIRDRLISLHESFTRAA